MNYIIYFILDCLDTLAVTVIMFSIFQYPIREYLREIGIIACILAVASIVGRELMGIGAEYDALNHMMLLILGLRFLIKVRLYRSFRIVGVGMIGYFAIQMSIVAVTTMTGLVDASMLRHSNSIEARLVQLLSQSVSYTIAYMIFMFNLGISKYIRPPHDFYLDTRITKEKWSVYTWVTVSLMLVLTCFYLYIERSEIVAALILGSILFTIVIMLTYRRDTSIERNRISI
ncbi:hypothetical protein A8990_105117 [Paenibacillus taihuensis]|uniref:Uncharacterized protein n=1 Tax=Paenibacillus taihuensis TaxID=1156355 RepID=A0A3D9SCU2_9BACL|nr:hypothetical protein [Paenibacillus taihuensis]REE91412.1 hypothetical protein A8990_105117 [Paenibacillus taihuensis]